MKTFLKYFVVMFLLTGLIPVTQVKPAKMNEHENANQLILNRAQEKALAIAREHIKSSNDEVREGAFNLFKALIDQKRAYDVALDIALECIASDKLRVVGLDLLHYLISHGRYYSHQKGSGSGSFSIF